MKTYKKLRIEYVVEAPIVRRLTQSLDEAGVTGYTVMPALSGKGIDGSWSRDGQIIDAGRMVVVLCIVDDSMKDAILELTAPILKRQIGIVCLSEVEVLRDDHF